MRDFRLVCSGVRGSRRYVLILFMALAVLFIPRTFAQEPAAERESDTAVAHESKEAAGEDQAASSGNPHQCIW